MQKNGVFNGRHLLGPPGEILSILLSDINGDSWLDVFVGNDFEEPHVYYYGSEDGVLSTLGKQKHYNHGIDHEP